MRMKMRKTTIYLRKTVIFIFLFFIAEAGYSQSPRKYTIEYGTVEYKTKNGTSKFYFIDYGNKFRQELIRENKLTTEIYDGKIFYSIANNKVDTLGAIRNPYFGSANPDGYKKNKNFKILPPKTILGNKCVGFEYYNTLVGQSISIYGFGNIVMMQCVDGVPIKEAVKFDPAKPIVSFRLK